MKRFFLLFLAAALLLALPALAEHTPDSICVSDYYLSYFDGYFHILYFYGVNASSGQVSICRLKDVLHDGPTPDLFIQDAYYETSGSSVVIREKRSSPDVYASGTAGSGFLDLTLDGENYYHFVYMKDNNKVVAKTDRFADVRDRFDEGFTVPAGLYIIGEDLPSGAFSFSSGTGCSIDIQQNNYNHFSFTLSPGGSFGKFELIDHQYLLVKDGSVTIRTFTGLFDK